MTNDEIINDQIRAVVKRLTYDQMEVLYWACQGLSRKEVANKISKDTKTYDFHIGNVYKKLREETDLEYPVGKHWTIKRTWLYKHVCPIVLEYVKNEEELNKWKPVIPELEDLRDKTSEKTREGEELVLETDQEEEQSSDVPESILEDYKKQLRDYKQETQDLRETLREERDFMPWHDKDGHSWMDVSTYYITGYGEREGFDWEGETFTREDVIRLAENLNSWDYKPGISTYGELCQLADMFDLKSDGPAADIVAIIRTCLLKNYEYGEEVMEKRHSWPQELKKIQDEQLEEDEQEELKPDVDLWLDPVEPPEPTTHPEPEPEPDTRSAVDQLSNLRESLGNPPNVFFVLVMIGIATAALSIVIIICVILYSLLDPSFGSYTPYP